MQNYPSLSEGISAMVLNLADTHHPQYQAMVHDLQQGIWDSANVVAGLQTWCGSTCYSGSAGQFIAEGQVHSGDLFDDSSDGSTPVTTPVTGQTTPPAGQSCSDICGPCDWHSPWNWPCCWGCSATNTQQASQPNPVAQWAKIGFGALLILFGVVLIGAILLRPVANSPVGKTASKAVSLLGA